MAMRLKRAPLPGRRTIAASFDVFAEPAPLDVLVPVPEEPVVVGAAVCGGVVNVISNEDIREREGVSGETIEGPRSGDMKRTYR